MRKSTIFLLFGLALIAWGGFLLVFHSSSAGLLILNTITCGLGVYICIMAGKLRAYDD